MSGKRGLFSRRRFIQGAGAAAATAGITQFGQSEAASAATVTPPPFQPRGKLRQRPNFLFIMADEYRYPVSYESTELKAFRARYLTAEQSLRRNGLEFTNHYHMSSACVPSRASIFTGQYPSLHGVSQTTGAAKASFENDTFWLDPNTVPTMGSYFRTGGYDTYYKGKWHISEADMLIPGTHDSLLSFDNKGIPIPRVEEEYLAASRLREFGFSGWIGPEPHGSNPLNSGSSAANAIGRDAKFATQTVDLLRQLSQQGRRGRPWLVVSSFTNPHDITVWGQATLASPSWNLRGQLRDSNVPSRGANQTTSTGFMYESVIQPNHVETVVVNLPTGRNGTPEKWKYSRYSDNPQFWSDPQSLSLTDSHLPPTSPDFGKERDVVTFIDGNVNRAGTNEATTTVKTDPVPDQTEAYNVTRDPLELNNLANSTNPAIRVTLRQLEAMLHAQCQAKRLKPRSGTVPSQPDC